MPGISYEEASRAVRVYSDTYNRDERLGVDASGSFFRYYIIEVKASHITTLPKNCELLNSQGIWSSERLQPLLWGGCIRRWKELVYELPTLEES